MKKPIIVTSIVFLLFSCSKDVDPPLIIPPNYAKLPSLEDEVASNQQNEEQKTDLKPLKDILLKD